MRLVVTGGRDYADHETVFRVLDALHASYAITELAHGNARGADTLADEWCVLRGIPRTKYHADWKGLGNAAGMARNRRMLDEFRPDEVIAFPGGSGTAGCVREALARGIRVRRVEPGARRIVVVRP